MANKSRSDINKDNIIGNKLDAFRDSFTSICEKLYRGFPGRVGSDQIDEGNTDLPNPAFDRVRRSKEWEGMETCGMTLSFEWFPSCTSSQRSSSSFQSGQKAFHFVSGALVVLLHHKPSDSCQVRAS
jgi:hypothetical protein